MKNPKKNNASVIAKNMLRGAIGDKTNSYAIGNALKYLKQAAPQQHIPELLKLASTSPRFIEALPILSRISRPSMLKRGNPLAFTSLERELTWSFALLLSSTAMLESYQLGKTHYLNSLFESNLIGAEEALTAIEEKTGWSLWLIENRIAVINMARGFEAQKSYVKELHELYPQCFASFFAVQVSQRNETAADLGSFLRRFNSRSQKWNIRKEFLTYIRYRIAGLGRCQEETVVAILAHESTTSITDLFETVIQLLPCLTLSQSLKSTIQTQLQKLSVIGDPRIDELLLRLQKNDYVVGDAEPDVAECMDTFALGNYDVARRACESARTIYPGKSNLIILEAILGLPEPSNEPSGLRYTIQDALRNVYTASDQAEDAVDRLRKLSLNWRYTPFSLPISFEAARFHDPEDEDFHQHNFSWPNFDFLDSVDISKPPSDLCHLDWFYLSRIKHSLEHHQFDVACEAAKLLQASELAFYRALGLLFEVRALSKRNSRIDALTRVVTHGVSRLGFLKCFDVPAIMNGYDYSEFSSSSSTLMPSIAFCILDAYGPTQYSALHCKMAVKQLLLAHKAQFPHKLASLQNDFDKEELIFFLNFVCTQKYIELCPSLNSPTELDQERIKVCQALIELDKNNLDSHNKEIVDLTLRVATERGIKIVDSTRVFVNEDALVNWADEELRDLYSRYLAHVEAGMVDAPEEVVRRIEAAMASAKKDDLPQLNIEENFRADGILLECVRDFSSAFLTLPRFGLNTFLGTRVRHGSLDGYIRARFEARKLIAFKDSKAGKYFPSEHWTDRLCEGDVKLERGLHIAFSDFSSKIDGILADAVLNRIQIKDSIHPEGIIEFATEKLNSAELLNSWGAAARFMTLQYPAFVDFAQACIDTFFWPGLDESLKRVQYFVKNSLSHRVIETLDKFAGKVSILIGDEKSRDFQREVVLVREDLDQAFNLLASWFSGRGSYDDQHSFTLEEVCEIALVATQNTRPHFSPIVTTEITGDANKRIALNSISRQLLDAMVIIFDNVSRRSGHEDHLPCDHSRPAVRIVGTIDDDRYLTVKVESDLHKSVPVIPLQEKVAMMRDVIARGDFIQKSQVEGGGSGFYRLASMFPVLSDDAKKNVAFGLLDDSKFFVQLRVLKKYVDGSFIPALENT